MSKELQKAAENLLCAWKNNCIDQSDIMLIRSALNNLKDETEPIAWAFQFEDGTFDEPSLTEHSAGMTPLYSAPSKRIQR